MYRVKITNPWYDSRNQFFIVRVSTTWVPFYVPLKEVRAWPGMVRFPEHTARVFYSLSSAEQFVRQHIPTLEKYREYQKHVKWDMENEVHKYQNGFGKPVNKRIV